MKLELTGFVLFVDDIMTSRKFYEELLGLKVVINHGNINIGYQGGLALWDRKYAQNNIFASDKVKSKSDDVEIYFESEDIDASYAQMKEKAPVINQLDVQPWQQKIFRVSDPDGFIIEFGEKMESVVKRLHNEGLSENEIVDKTFMPKEFVASALK